MVLYGTCVNQGQQEHRGRSERRDTVPIKLLRQVSKRAMAELVHVTATRLVWQRRKYIWVGYDQGVHLKETGGSGGSCGGILYLVRQERHSTFKRLPSNSDGRNTTSKALPRERVACWEGCLACTSCAYPPALWSAIAGNQPAVAVGLFRKNAPRTFDFMSSAGFLICFDNPFR